MKSTISKLMAAMAVGAMLFFACALAPRSQADPGATTYYAYFGANNLGTITSGTSVTLSRLGTLSTYPLTLGTGGTGSFTVTLVLSDSNVIAGDKIEVPVTYPAGLGQQALAIYDSGTNGTLLHSSTTTAIAGTALLEFVNVSGSAWAYTPKGDLGTRTLGGGVQTALQQPINTSGGLLSGSAIGVYTTVPGLYSTSSAPGQYSIAGTPVSSGSAAVSGSSAVSGSAVYAGSAIFSGSANQSGFTYSLANATGTLSNQASVSLPPVLSSTSISGCVEDLDADQPAGSGTTSVAANTTVTTWVALAGSNATALSGSNAPIFQPGKGLYFNGSSVMSIPSVVSGSTYVIVIDYTPGLASNSPLLLTGNSQYGQVIFSSTNAGNQGVCCAINGSVPGWDGSFAITPAQTGEGNTIMTSFDSTGLIYQDGFPQTFYQGSLSVSIANNTCYLGNIGAGIGGNNFVGWIRRVRIFNVVPTASQYESIFQSDAAKYKSPASNELIIDGDSISSLVTNNALSKTGLAAYLNGAWDIRSAAWGGKTLAADAADDAAFASMQDIRHPAPVVMEWLGTNDIYANLVSGTGAYASLVTRCLVRRNAGNRIAVVTMLPRASANQEAQRQIFNGLVRANFRQFADAIIDLKDLAPTMDSYSTNFTTISGTNYLTTTGSTQYQGDLIHPTGLGASLIAQAEASVINGMAPASGLVPVSSTSGQILVSNTTIGANAAWTGAIPGGNVALGSSAEFTLKGYGTMGGMLLSSEIAGNLTHWWSFSPSLTDDLIGGNNFVNNGGLVTSGTSLIGGAVVFTGSNGCGLYGSTYYGNTGASFSVCFWFNTPSFSAAQILTAERSVGGPNQFWQFYLNTGGQMVGQIYNSSSTGATAQTSTAASPNTWNFACMTVTSGSVCSVSLNGSPFVTGTLTGGFSASGYPLTLGGCYYGGQPFNAANGNNYTGRIADYRVFQSALSQAAVNAIYAHGLNGGVSTDKLSLSGTAASPVNSGTAAAWFSVTCVTSGTNTTYKLPLYQ
jgi:lysophospholipase L1-like esterase